MNSKTTIAIAVMLTAAALVIPSMASVSQVYAKDTCGEDVKEINIKIVNPKAGAGSTIGPINICPNVDLKPLEDRVTAAEGSVSNVQGNVTAVRNDVSAIQTSLSNITSDVNQAKNDASGAKTEVSNVRSDLATVQNDVGQVKTDIIGINNRLDNISSIEACVTFANGSSTGVCPPSGGDTGTGGNNTGNGTGTGTGTNGTGTGTGGGSTGNGTTGNGTVIINGTGNGGNESVIVNSSGGFIPQLLAGINSIFHS